MRGSSGPYFYHKTRGPGGRIRSTYIGNGPMAVLMAEATAAMRSQERYRGAALRCVLCMLDGLGDAVEALTSRVNAEFGAHMEQAGYRYKKGVWRKPRKAPCPASFQGALPLPVPAPSRIADQSPSPIEPLFAVAEASCPGETAEWDYEAIRQMEEDSEHERALRHLIPVGIREAQRLRYLAEWHLRQEEGDQSHPDYVWLSEAAVLLTMEWGAWPLAREEMGVEGSQLDRRRWKGRKRQNRTAAAGPHDGSTAMTALAMAGVLDELGVEGRGAVEAFLLRRRAQVGWAKASMLGRVVLDQHALAIAYAMLVDALSKTPSRSADQGSVIPDHRRKRWEERVRKAGHRVQAAGRLMRHAKKAGALIAGAAPFGQGGSPTASATFEDPIAILRTPPPLEPLGEDEAASAAAQRDHIEAVRAAWPPPERVRLSELERESCPWNPVFDYCYESPGDSKDDPWMLSNGRHMTPDEMEARLAEWAPDYVSSYENRS
jgi:hypothetical protein